MNFIVKNQNVFLFEETRPLIVKVRTMLPTKMKMNQRCSSVDGLTLIECLVAIVVIAITTAAIGPMMVFSVATRVQNQKVAQASQLAQAEIDKVRLTVEQGGDYAARLEELFVMKAPAATEIVGISAPERFRDSTQTMEEVTDARMVDLDGDKENDFAVQLFRTPGIEVDDTPVAFDLGVRVYDIRAEEAISSLQTDAAGLAFTSGEGERRTRPLAVLYSRMAQGDRQGSLCQYWKLTDPTGTKTVPPELNCKSIVAP